MEIQIEEKTDGVILLDWFKQNYGWISSLFAIFGTLTGFIIRLNDYLNYTFICSYFGLSKEYYYVNELSLFFTIGMGMLVLFLIVSAIYCYYHFWKCIFKKKKGIISDIFVTFFINAIFVYIFHYNYLFSFEFAIAFLTITALSYLFSVIIYLFINRKNKSKSKKHNNYEDNTEDFINYCKKMPWLIIFVILLTSFFEYQSIVLNNNYVMVNSDEICKAIVYTTPDYYLTLDCKITDDNRLIIYKGSQMKLETNNVKTKLITFKSVSIKEKQKRK